MTTFIDRQKELFNQLKAAEKQALYVVRGDTPERGNLYVQNKRHVRQTRAEMRQFRGKESIFKRPEAPLTHCLPPRRVPGYLKNPDKWTCYNLENVPDISERSNAEAAAMCRRDIILDSENKDILDSDDCGTKVVFKPPILIPGDDNKPKAIEYKNTVVVYPEHVVGQRNKSNKVKKEKPKASRSTQPVLKLDHLEEDIE